MHNAYKYSIIYFSCFVLLLLVSALMLFVHKIGFDPTQIAHYYLGDGDLLLQKTNAGIFKLILPHIFAFGVLSFVVIHFLIFTDYKKRSYTLMVIYILLIVQALEIFSPLLIINVSEYFSYLKLISFIVYMLFIPLIFFWLFKSILKA
ncbi:hypothetical protein [Sulfurimonas microaerophilic]|uniref:hypothetical protein n=1 Tax=Sulfurimonas microaerophilic TaxID=3058392 RepID=UPI002714602A|nr:hypothetical protein [Sulfurimonas sp. hsl 1-7]